MYLSHDNDTFEAFQWFPPLHTICKITDDSVFAINVIQEEAFFAPLSNSLSTLGSHHAVLAAVGVVLLHLLRRDLLRPQEHVDSLPRGQLRAFHFRRRGFLEADRGRLEGRHRRAHVAPATRRVSQSRQQ